ncbi:MAG: Hsp20/alpha crystallin family protein [Rhodospirillales bacterium]|nr:Hsp20/alpha crystallin family protein [Rhodospirillales bacterium]
MAEKSLVDKLRDNPLGQVDYTQALDSIKRQVGTALDEMWKNIGTAHIGDSGRALNLSADQGETEKKLVISVELPGMNEEDVEISIKDNVLTLSGEKKSEHEVKGLNFYQRERFFGEFERAFQLPAGADIGKASAEMDMGVLTITIPKIAPSGKKARKISIKGGKSTRKK